MLYFAFGCAILTIVIHYINIYQNEVDIESKFLNKNLSLHLHFLKSGKQNTEELQLKQLNVKTIHLGRCLALKIQ